ncbi:unnamed protein product [Urochloa decumbens]|uniref:Polyamine transporter n=1 Tax=Urochloa decumbens TaxID=240449 RepID=A0ABC8XV17_9POAL
MAGEAHLGADAVDKDKNADADAVAVAAAPNGAGGGGHKLSLVPLIFLIFFEVAGGPYGAEPAVQSAGPLYALLGFLIFPFIWAIPESLVTAELSTALPGNGGFVLWADRAFGPFSGSLMGTWKYVSGAINGAAFPALCADYLGRVVPAVADDGGPRVATIVVFNVVLTVLNYTGLAVVGWTAVGLGLASLSPFVLMSGIALPKIRPRRWGGVAAEKDWKLFFNTLFWNLNYWDSVSTMAGEVERPGKTLPKALVSAVSMTSLGYLLPLMAATGAIDVAPEDWGNGFFADAAELSPKILEHDALVKLLPSHGISRRWQPEERVLLAERVNWWYQHRTCCVLNYRKFSILIILWDWEEYLILSWNRSALAFRIACSKKILP